MAEPKVHARAFAGYAWSGTKPYEREAPLCGAQPDDPDMTRFDALVTCKRCRKMLKLDEPKEAPE